ncbi:MAG: hypothetical protein FWD58_08895 [Firmicutes bacterium]|nr:hypothetical protein [Bacillota bacterium]
MHPLEKLSKEAGDYVTEKNRPWFEDVMEEHYPGYKEQQKQKKIRKHRLRLTWISLSSSMAAVAIVVSLVLLWPLMFPISDDPPGKHYLLENEESTASNLAALNADAKNFLLELDAACEGEVRQWFDSVSGDILYYSLIFENQDSLEAFKIYVYVNPDYKIPVGLEDATETISLGKFEITYFKKIINDDWAFVLTYHAITEYSGVTIYIEYEQLSLDEESNFFNFFSQTFQVI